MAPHTAKNSFPPSNLWVMPLPAEAQRILKTDHDTFRKFWHVFDLCNILMAGLQQWLCLTNLARDAARYYKLTNWSNPYLPSLASQTIILSAMSTNLHAAHSLLVQTPFHIYATRVVWYNELIHANVSIRQLISTISVPATPLSPTAPFSSETLPTEEVILDVRMRMIGLHQARNVFRPEENNVGWHRCWKELEYLGLAKCLTVDGWVTREGSYGLELST